MRNTVREGPLSALGGPMLAFLSLFERMTSCRRGQSIIRGFGSHIVPLKMF